VLEPTIGNYFRNSAQDSDVIAFLSTRKERQASAREHINKVLDQYDVNGVDTLIGDIAPPESLMKTLTDRKIAEEQKVTYDTSAWRRKRVRTWRSKQPSPTCNARSWKPTRGAGSLNASLTRLLRKPRAMPESVKLNAAAEAERTKLIAGAEAQRIQMTGSAEAEKILAIGKANAESYELQVRADGRRQFHPHQDRGDHWSSR